MMHHLPKAPTTQYTPHAVGKVEVKHVKLPAVFPITEDLTGLFSEDATIPLVRPSSKELHPRVPLTAHIVSIEEPKPTAPKNLGKGLKSPATKIPFGAVPLEKHSKHNIPLAFRG